MDFEYDIFERKVYSLLDLLGDIGGVSNSLTLIGVFIIGIFQDDLLRSALIRTIYQVNKQYSDNNEDNCDDKEKKRDGNS
jgi:hypothetical protein